MGGLFPAARPCRRWPCRPSQQRALHTNIAGQRKGRSPNTRLGKLLASVDYSKTNLTTPIAPNACCRWRWLDCSVIKHGSCMVLILCGLGCAGGLRGPSSRQSCGRRRHCSRRAPRRFTCRRTCASRWRRCRRRHSGSSSSSRGSTCSRRPPGSGRARRRGPRSRSQRSSRSFGRRRGCRAMSTPRGPRSPWTAQIQGRRPPAGASTRARQHDAELDSANAEASRLQPHRCRSDACAEARCEVKYVQAQRLLGMPCVRSMASCLAGDCSQPATQDVVDIRLLGSTACMPLSIC
jgi:hypothetical protein